MIQVLITFALFASATTVNKVILQSVPPILFVGIRMLLAGGIMASYFGTQQRSHFTWNVIRKQLMLFIPIGLSTMYIPSILKAYALKNATSSKIALIGSLDPFITALYGYALWGQRLHRNHIIGIILGFCGTLLMIDINFAHDMPDHWWIFSPAEVAALGSVAISRLGWIGVQRLLHTDWYRPAELNSILMLIGGTVSLATAWIIGETQALPVLEQTHIWGLIAYTVIIGNIIAYTGYSALLRMFSVTYVSLAGLLIPLFVHLYGPFILHEPLSPIFFIAISVFGCGLWLFNRTPLQRS